MGKIYQKHDKPITISLRVDYKDLEWLDDRRGNMSRNEFLTECMYMSHSNHQIIKQHAEAVTGLRAEIQELKKQLMFEHSKNGNEDSIRAQNGAVEDLRRECFKGIESNLRASYRKNPALINWKNLFEKYPHLEFKTIANLREWFVTKLKDPAQGATS